MTQAEAALAPILARPGVRRVLGLLDQRGESARIIGGAVRNALLGIPVADIDIATTALPDEVLARAERAGLQAVPTGYDHGTVTLIMDGVPYEVTTLREDIETDGRRAIVRYGRSFEQDALRRDFTINALSAGAEGRIHDYAGGLADLAARRVRFIGDACQRIREDYLRSLRFFRFSASYGDGSLDSDGLAAITANLDGLGKLSRERVRQEFVKLLVTPQAVPIVAAMQGIGMLEEVCRTVTHPGRLERCTFIEQSAGLPPQAIRRLLCLAVSTASDIETLRDALRLTNREHARLLAAIAAGQDAGHLLAGTGEAALKVAIYRHGAEAVSDALIREVAMSGGNVTQTLALLATYTAPVFLLGGKDFLALGLAPGPDVGRLLAAAEAAWIEAGLPADIDAQQRILRQVTRT